MIQLPSPLIIELPLKGRIVIIKIMKKNKGFCGRAADIAHHLHFLRVLRENWGKFQSGMYVRVKESIKKIRFHGIYIEVKQLCDKYEA